MSTRRPGPLRPTPSVGTAADLDTGLQPERTALAWSRTLMSFAIVTAVCLRWLPHYGPVILALPALTALAALVILINQRARTARGVRGIRAGVVHADPVSPLLVVLLSVAVGVAGTVVVLLA